MNKKQIEKLSDDALFELYCLNAEKHDQLADTTDFKLSNLAIGTLGRAYKEIVIRGLNARFLSLLADVRDGVRLWTAWYHLFSAPEVAEAILMALAKRPGIAAHQPRLLLELWRRGEVKYD
jgi:hypothetical protein